MHSGWGRGPTTEAGKARSLEALRRANAARAAARYAATPAGQIERLAAQGLSLAAIVAETGLDPDFVRQHLLAPQERPHG